MLPKKSKITRSTASKRQLQEIDSLASLSSPSKSSKSKKSPLVSKEKQASLKLPEREMGIIAQAVTETKQTKSSKEEKSSDNENSTGSESDLFEPQVKMAPFGVKLKPLLKNYFMAKGDQHDIRQAFIHNDILTFDLLIGMCTLQFLRNMKLKKGNNSVNAFNEGKLKLVNNMLLYYNFLYQDDKDALAEDPTQWVVQAL